MGEDRDFEVSAKALKLAVATYIQAKEMGCEENVALAFAQNAHQHWLFALGQKAKQEFTLFSQAVKGD